MQHALRLHDEGKIVRDAQPGEHGAALVGPGVGAQAQPGPLGLQLCQQGAHTGLQVHRFVQLGDHVPHHVVIFRLGQGQVVFSDEVAGTVGHAHGQQHVVQVCFGRAAIALQQRQRGTPPHHGHAVGEGAVHIKDPLLAAHGAKFLLQDDSCPVYHGS